ncbi:MAG: WGR domain-containing protein, partial [Desulfuromonadales bacterium]|nr:WGR domain-containing protein [Desulfuromonadales bacterium]
CVSVEAGLFGPILVRSWGRIGWRKLRHMEQHFSEEKLPDILNTANHLITRKLRKGYELLDWRAGRVFSPTASDRAAQP